MSSRCGSTGAGDRVQFVVADEGLGIPPPRRAIFESSTGSTPDLTRGVGGTGLGLYICASSCGGMNGASGSRAADGPGSCFVVELPA